MSRLTDLWFRIKTLLSLGRAEREMDEEFAFHVEMAARKLEAGGLSPEKALAEARRRFGGLTRERQRARDEWGVGWVRDLGGDLRHALRQFRRRPGFTLIATVTLGLGIGSTVALFSVVRGLLLRPLPVQDEERIHVFWHPFDWRGVEFDFVKDRAPELEAVAAYTPTGFTMDAGDGTTMVFGVEASAELFRVLGTAPLMGRTFAPGEDRPGAEPVVVVSWQLWQRALGADPDVIGRRIRLAGSPFTIIGVMPRGFFFPTPSLELWRPLVLDPATDFYQGNGYLALIAKTRPNVTPAEVQGAMEGIGRALGERFTYPAAWDKTKDPSATSLREFTVGDARPALLLLLGAVTLLLMMAGANVAALVLARTTDRGPEIALRAALGAGRGRLVRQVVTESVTLAVLAGMVGVGLAVVAFRLLVRKLPLDGGLESALSLDWTLLASALGLSLLVGLLVSVAPVRDLLAGRMRGVGRARSGGLDRGHRRFHGGLVAGEVGLAVLLVTGSLLFVRSVSRLYAVDPGFDPTGVVSFDLVTPFNEVLPVAERRQIYRDVVERVAGLPGVEAAALTPRLPIRDPGLQGPIDIEDRPELQGRNGPNALYRPVTPSFFPAMGIAIVRGRPFSDADRDGSLPVAIVSQSFADQIWPGQDPIGHRVRGVAGGAGWLSIVGVAEETRWFGMTGDNPFALYVPFEQGGWFGFDMLVVRSRLEQGELSAAVRRVVADRSQDVALSRITSMADVVDTALAEPLRLRFFLSLFAGLALVLGAVGIYGVVSYSVSRRRTEFGVRMALGAAPGRVVAEVVRQGLRPVAVGIGAGLALAVASSRLVAGMLYGIAATDPPSLAVAAAALLLAGGLAALVPGLRAGRTSPIESLRSD